MTDVSISSFRQDVQDYIEQHHLDGNGDNFINSDNGELAELLSKCGETDINNLYNTGTLRAPYTNLTIGTTLAGFGTSYAGQKLTSRDILQKEYEAYSQNQLKANEIIHNYNNQAKAFENSNQKLHFLTDIKDRILSDNKLSQTKKKEVLQLLDDMITKEVKPKNLAAVAPKDPKTVAKELRNLLKQPFLLRHQNAIKQGTLWGTAFFLTSALFFGAKAVMTHESEKPLEFKA